MNPDTNSFNLDEDGEADSADYSECVNTFGLEDGESEDDE